MNSIEWNIQIVNMAHSAIQFWWVKNNQSSQSIFVGFVNNKFTTVNLM